MLPLHSSSRTNRSNGLSIPSFNRPVAFSAIWALISLCVICYGFWRCTHDGYSFLLECGQTDCKYTSTLKDYDHSTESFPREGLYGVTILRIKGDTVYRAEDVKRRRGRYGYTVELQLSGNVFDNVSKSSANRTILFAPHDLGKRTTEKYEKEAINYIGHNSDELIMHSSKVVSLIGVMAIFLGFTSFIISLVLGEWREAPRRLKKIS